MGTRKESERTKFIQEKCQTLLTQMLRDEDNKYCVDCDAKGPRWASWNLGIFLCIRCAGIHRNLGVHISRVKSVNLDSWTPEQVMSLQQMGNSRARAVYEAQLPDGFRRPQTDSALESFVRAKYEHKKYMAREWVPSPPAKANWDKEVDEEMERLKRKKKTGSSLSGISGPIGNGDKKPSTISVKTPLPAPLPKPKANSSSPKTSSRGIVSIDNNSGSSDLLGLSSPTTANGSANAPSSDLNGGDIFSNFLSGPPSENSLSADSLSANNSANLSSLVGDISGGGTLDVNVSGNGTQSLAKEEEDFFNQVPTEKEKTKMTRDSILALYATAPTTSPGLNSFNGVGGGFAQFPNAMPAYGVAAAPPNNLMGGYTGIPSGQQVANQNFMHTTTGAAPQQQFFGNFMQSNVAIPPQQQQQQQNGTFASFPAMQPAAPFSNQQQPFAQFQQLPLQQQQLPPQATTNNANNLINQQFGNLNLGNVWQ